MKYLIIIFLMVGSIFNLYSQGSKYKKGYIITLENNKVYGELKVRGEASQHNKVFLKKENGNSIFFPSEITGYMLDDKLFVSYNSMFLEEIVHGHISLFIYRYNQSMPGAGGFYATTASRYYFLKDGKYFRLKGNNFRKNFKKNFPGYPKVTEKVEAKEFRYTYNYMPRIVRELNSEYKKLQSMQNKN